MSRTKINEQGIQRMLSFEGPIGRHVSFKARQIHRFARSNIQTKLDSRTGDLEAALRQIDLNDSTGYHVVVGTDAQHRGFPYARALETGRNPFTGEEMAFYRDTSFMVPAVISAGFRLRQA